MARARGTRFFGMLVFLAERNPRLVLTLLVALLGLSGLADIPPIDRDEPEFAQPARQMLETGDFVEIRFQSEPFYEKPVLTFWLQAASASVFGGPDLDRIWAYRLPSVIAVLLATLLTYQLGLTLFDRRAALPAATLFASMLLVQTQAHQARADALLLASMLGVVLPLAHVYVTRSPVAQALSPRMTSLFWVSLAAAILIKGPVVPLLIALAIATLVLQERDWRWLAPLRPRWGVPLFALILLPWPIAILSRHGPSFFIQAWQSDILPKIVSGQESHGAPPLTYTLSAPLILWPTTLLLPSALEFAWRYRRDPSVRFCIASIVPGWLLFELAPTKLPHYILPLVPMLTLLMTAHGGQTLRQLRSLVSLRIGALLFLFASLLIVAAIPFALLQFDGDLDLVAVVGTLLLLASAVLAAGLAWRGAVERSAWAAVLCGVLATLLIAGITVPRLQRLWVAERAAQVVRSVAPPAAPTLVVGYSEPSLVFLLGTHTRFVDAGAAAAALQTDPATTAIVANESAPEFVRAASSLGADVEQISVIDGTDPAHFRPIQLGVWRIRPRAGGSPR